MAPGGLARKEGFVMSGADLEGAVADAQSGRGVLAGIGWALLGTLAFTIIFSAAKLLGLRAEIGTLQIVLMRFLGGFVTVCLLLPGQGGPRALATTRLPAHGLRAACAVGGVACSIYAATYLPLVEASAIGLLHGIFVVLLAVPMLGEVVTARHWRAVLVCLAGALVVVLGQGQGMGLSLPAGMALPALIAVLGAGVNALEAILIKTLTASERPIAVLFYVNLFGTALLALPAFWFWAPMSGGEWLALATLGPLAIAGQYCNIRAFRLVAASLLGPVGYSRLIFAGLLGFLASGEVPGAATLAGGAVLVLGGVMLTRLHARPR